MLMIGYLTMLDIELTKMNVQNAHDFCKIEKEN